MHSTHKRTAAAPVHATEMDQFVAEHAFALAASSSRQASGLISLGDGAWASAGPAWATALGRRWVQALGRRRLSALSSIMLGRRRLGEGESSSRRRSALSSIMDSSAVFSMCSAMDLWARSSACATRRWPSSSLASASRMRVRQDSIARSGERA